MTEATIRCRVCDRALLLISPRPMIGDVIRAEDCRWVPGQTYEPLLMPGEQIACPDHPWARCHIDGLVIQ